ncbi:MAG: hypothetical protein WCT47_15815 [Betaproteobacteria bacterium]|jgi:hypothetical protein
MFPTFAALFFTVVLMVTTAYFLMGGLPLLVLKHDTALDARFVRSFFDIYYKAAFFAATGAAISYALSSRPAFAMGNAGVAVMVMLLRTKLIAAMAQLDDLIQQGEMQAIRRFKKVHCAALAMNLAQLIGLVWGLTQISL